MEFISLIVSIIIIVFVLKLRVRVSNLEQFINKHSAESNYQPQMKQSEVAKATASISLVDSVRAQLKQGISREEIKTILTVQGWQLSDIDNAFNSIILPTQSSQPAVPLAQTGPTSFEKFSAWMKEDLLLKFGALLLLIGFGWLTTYAFLNNWIGPMGRITIGIIAGSFFILLGWWRIKKYIHQGGVFLVLGSTTILLTVFAAREIYHFFSPLSALTVMFLSTAFVALASVKYNSRSLALASLVLAGIAPLLTNSPSQDYIGLFSYLFVVVLGAIWVGALTRRHELTAAALILVGFYSLQHLLSFTSRDADTLLLFAYAFSSVFFLANTVGILKLKGKEIIPDLVTAAGNGLFLLAWIMVAAQDEWKSLIISAWMIVFSVGAFLIFRITKRREPLFVYAGVGIAMLAAATSAELKGATLTIAYIIESGVISLIAYSILRDKKIAEQISLLLVGPMILSVQSITSRAWTTGFIHKDFFVLLIMGLILLGLGLMFLRRAREVENKGPQQLNAALFVSGSAYIFLLLWLSLRAILPRDNDVAVMISLTTYTIIGLITYLYGLKKEKKGLRIYGGVLLGFVIGRLLLVDVWRMQLAGRTVTFFLIGALLMSTAFLGKRKHGPLLPHNSQ
ncbi:MAG: hypothetical protein HW401_531 [Parcubacteria group bacterium]|nr:hypothetical protein [Parcubacteria group bacterium]